LKSTVVAVVELAVNVPLLVPHCVNVNVAFHTVGIACATAYTCASVAGLVPVLVAAVVLLGNTGSDVNVLTPPTL
jgi:hypothetical protein